MVSPLGLSVQENWANILAGKSGIRHLAHFDVSDYACRIGGSVWGFDINNNIPAKAARRMDPFIHNGIAAGMEANKDAGLEVTEENAERIGVAIGSGIGGLPGIEKGYKAVLEGGPRKVSPFFIPSNIINMISGDLSIMYGMKGPNIAYVTACTTGAHSLGEAGRIIEYGDADVMVAGGAKIYAELIGFGMSADAYHMTQPSEGGDGARRCMLNALRNAGVNIDEVDYINAHGTSTPVGDRAETLAVKSAFGDHARRIAMSSTKSMTGHLLGAAGGIEAIYSVLAIRDQVAPPTINQFTADPDCDLDYVPNEARNMKIDTVLSNSFGFGGTNGTLVFRKPA